MQLGLLATFDTNLQIKVRKINNREVIKIKCFELFWYSLHVIYFSQSLFSQKC